MNGLRRIRTPFLLLPLVLIGFGVYSSGLGIQYYHDDFQFVFESPSSKILYYFTHNNQLNNFYRPIQAAFLAAVQTLFDTNTLPVHATQILVHILLSWLIFVFMTRLGFSVIQAAVGSVFMLVSQANVHAVLSNDTLSQIGGTAFGCISLLALYSYRPGTGAAGGGGELIRSGHHPAGLLMYILALLSKESSISFFPLLLVIIILGNSKTGNRKQAALRTMVEAAPYLVVTALYFIARSYVVEAQPALGAGRYNFHLGVNIPRNLAMFMFAVSTPISSVSVFEAFVSGGIALFSSIAAVSIALIAITAYGLRRAGRHRTACILAGFAIISLFPAVMLNRVSELYVYNSMPFISILVGISLGKLLEPGRAGMTRRVLVPAVAGLLLISHITAVQGKAALMRSNGERAGRLLGQIVLYTHRVPGNGSLLLLNPPGNGMEYSVFHLKGFNVLKGGLHRIKHLSGRNDLTIDIIDPPDMERIAAESRAGRLILSLQGDDVQVYAEQPVE